MLKIYEYLPITDPTLIFFVVLLIILFAPIVMGRLRIPHIIGMVLAGVLIGQYGLNILERDASFELFGNVGLYYIMFLAGLEMDLEGMRKNLRQMAIFGLLTFAVPFLILGLPLFDTAFAFIRRIAHGQSPMHADRGHIHHRLIDMGLNQKQAVATLYVISAILGLSAVVLTTSSELKAMVFFLTLCVVAAVAARVAFPKEFHEDHKPEKKEPYKKDGFE